MNKFTIPGKKQEVKGAVNTPINSGLRLVVMNCGVDGKLETDLQKLLVKSWPMVRTGYKGWFASQNNFKLGNIYDILTNSETRVVCMLVEGKDGKKDPEAVQKSVKLLLELAKKEKASVHISRVLLKEMVGMEEMLEKEFIPTGVSIYFYN